MPGRVAGKVAFSQHGDEAPGTYLGRAGRFRYVYVAVTRRGTAEFSGGEVDFSGVGVWSYPVPLQN